MFFDWHRFHATEFTTPTVVDPRLRLRLCLFGFAAMVLVVFGRAAQLEVTEGAAFRAEANRPLRREQSLPGTRGRILAHDGTVLACDTKVLAVAVRYRYLQNPPDARWLRANARARLPKLDRKDADRVAAEQERMQAERIALAHRLADLCGMSPDEWRDRARQVQARVERIAEGVYRRRLAEAASAELSASDPPGWLPEPIGRSVWDAFQTTLDDARPTRVAVAEESDCHVMAEDVPLAVAAEIEGNPERYPGVKILQRSRRSYPAGTLAAHVLGHLGPVEPEELAQRRGPDACRADDIVGRMGLERQYEQLLRGRRGLAVELADHTGRVLSSVREQEPGVGRDLVLTLDSRLQRSAEELLESALKRRDLRDDEAAPAGGAVVVMDVHSGALRAVASAPRFDPSWFVADKTDQAAAALDDRSRPLFDRACRMAIPPGSVFKTVSAVALLETAAIDPEEPYCCQGYLRQPDSQRCEVYVRRGVGHGDVTLSDALCVSCNVYFFHHAGEMGPAALVDWARRLGFGRPTGVDLPGEAAGTLPTPDTIGELEGHAWRAADTQSLSIGQGSLTATPLQVVRMMAAVANGGQLVVPHVSEQGRSLFREGETSRVPVLRRKTLQVVRDGLERVVADDDGTARGTVCLETIAVAGKTGTAETGGGRPAHAWFAGYAPAERPRMALVVVLEHAGSGATAAGPVAKRLVLRMQQLGML